MATRRNSLTTITRNLPAVRKDLAEKREHVAVAIDHSGSMSTDFSAAERGKTRQQAAYEATVALLSSSSDDSSLFTILGFDHQVRIAGTQLDSFSAIAVSNFHSEGGTDLALALSAAMAQGIDRIVALTDGETPREPALEQARVAKSMGIKIDTIGIGDSDMSLLQEIAELTGGFFRQPRTSSELVSAFVQLETNNRLMLEHQGTGTVEL